MRISDEITAYILRMMDQAENGEAELQRNLLAEELGCVPSQISYVLTSRFTPEQGYVVESRGGGYIRIHRVKYQPEATPLMHVVNSIGDSLSAATASGILDNLLYRDTLSQETAKIMAAALSDRAYRDVEPAQRDRLRASLMKQMLTALIA